MNNIDTNLTYVWIENWVQIGDLTKNCREFELNARFPKKIE